MANKQTSSQIAQETDRARDRRNELVDLIAEAIPEDGWIEPLKGLFLFRASAPGEPIYSVYNPAFCVVAQGSKEFFLNDEHYIYDPSHYLLVTAELPLVGQILNASQEQPYLSLRLDLDPTLVSSVVAEVGDFPPQNQAGERAINVSSLDADFLDAVTRLVRLVFVPSKAPFLAPLITREIVYRLWTGEQRERLLHIVNSVGYTSHIARAIERINQDFDQQLRMESIASDLGMSVSGFHRHFKAVTAMSPLQYQKRLRLQEARRLLLGEGLNATGVAFQVGYNDASHFSREYKSLFGRSPRRDIEHLRATT